MSSTESTLERALLTEGTSRPSTKATIRYSGTALILPFLLATVTFAFGGVHDSVLIPTEMCLFLLGLVVFKKSIALTGSQQKNFHLCISLLILTLMYWGVQLILLNFCTIGHPVLLEQSCHPASAAAFSTLLFFCSCLAFFFLAGTQLSLGQSFLRLSSISIWALGLAVALISLSHWFYDSGKLFWTFAPEHIFPSRRARWPFVNANHLGHFLLLILFFAIGIFRISSNRFQKRLFETPRFSEQPLLRILPKPRYLYPLIRLCFQAVLILSLLLSIAASLSRSTWVGMLIGLIVLSSLSFLHKSHLPEPAAPPTGLRAAKRKRRNDNRGVQQKFILLKKRINILLGSGVALLFCFFLSSGQGIELIEGRIEFGFASSKSDIRWMLYEDSARLLKKAPFTGIGLSTWSSAYNQVMSPELANVTPEYLHSDPFQLYLETGLLGITPMLCIFIWISFQLIVHPPREYACVLAHSLYAGIVGLLSASFLDFPFRIPAICYLLMFMLAILVYLLDTREHAEAVNSELRL